MFSSVACEDPPSGRAESSFRKVFLRVYHELSLKNDCWGCKTIFFLVRILVLFFTATFYFGGGGVILANIFKIFFNQEGLFKRGLWQYAESKPGVSLPFLFFKLRLLCNK